MPKLKNEKGITLIALVITVAVLSIISIPVVINTKNVSQFEEYTKFKDDIDNLRESIGIAYFDKDIRTIGPKYEGSLQFLNETQNGLSIKNENDNNVYYAINIDRINENLVVDMNRLNNGNGNKNIGNIATVYSGTDDVYIINEASRTIYYVKGVLYNGERYYRLYEEYSETSSGVTPGEIVGNFNKIYTDIYGAKAKIPVGYKVSTKPEEQVISKGLVILDNNGNEFVWVPVQEFKDENGQDIEVEFDRYKYGNQINNGINNESNSFTFKNNASDSYYFYEKEDNFEQLSVLENKGFYIGRYETGSQNARTAGSAQTAAIIKKNISVYNYVTLEEAINLSQSFISNNKYLKSKLCSSYAWDTALKFIEKTGNVSYLTTVSAGTSLANTGTSTPINNIYDLAGNIYEWTTEKSSLSTATCTARGGLYNKTDLAITRLARASAKSGDIGYRITLFLSVD